MLEPVVHIFETIGPLALGGAAFAGLGLTILCAVGWLRQRAKRRTAEAEQARLEAVARKGREILAAAPDGLFLWDYVLGGVTVSSRLAVLLGLENGTRSRYDDIRECFKGESLKALERGCSALRGNGTPFDLVLYSDGRLIQAIGHRAETDTGETLADLVWMRDVSELAGSSAKPQAQAQAENDKTATGFDDRHLTALLDAMPIPVWLRDSNLNLAFVNKTATNMVESNPDLAAQAHQSGQISKEQRLVDWGGTAHLMEIIEVPLGIPSAGGVKQTSGTLGYALDRSEREEMDAARLRHQQARDAVLEALPTAVAIFGADTHLEFANSAYAELWRMDALWLSDKPTLSEVLEKQREDRKLPEVPDFRAFKNEQMARFHLLSEAHKEMLYLPDGRSLRQHIQPHASGGLVYVLEDMSDRLGLERSVKELDAVQVETLDNLHEGVVVIGSDGRLKLHNPVFVDLWNLDPAQLAGRPRLMDILDQMRPLYPAPEGLDDWTEEAWAAHKVLVSSRLLSRQTSAGQITLTNGTVIHYDNVSLPDGAILMSYVDISDSAKVETALRERAEAMEQANVVKSEFIADVGREVRTPLNTIIGYADILSQEYFGELTPRQREYASSIIDTGNNLMSVVSDVLDLAVIDAGRMEFEQSSIDVHDLLVSVSNLVRDRIKRRNQHLEFDCTPDIGWMTGDAARLKQVLYNLLSNASIYTPPRGNITLSAERNGDAFVFRVTDTGVGIPTSDKQQVFNPFDRGAPTSPANVATPESASGKSVERGVGLGLTIAKRFVEHHGGSIDIRSQLGRGTTVEVTLPSATDPANDPTEQTNAEPSIEPAAEPDAEASPAVETDSETQA